MIVLGLLFAVILATALAQLSMARRDTGLCPGPTASPNATPSLGTVLTCE